MKDNNLLMIAISGDGCEKEGLATIMLELEQDDFGIIGLLNKEDEDKVNNLLTNESKIGKRLIRVLHIDLFKKYLKDTRGFIYSDRFMDKFNSDNQMGLYDLFVNTGNVIIQKAGLYYLIYLPKYMSDGVKNSLIEMEKYIPDDSKVQTRKVINSETIESELFDNYNDFIKNKLNITK